MKGRGLIGAVAAIPFYTRFEEALETVHWAELKAALLEIGAVRLSGEPADQYHLRISGGARGRRKGIGLFHRRRTPGETFGRG